MYTVYILKCYLHLKPGLKKIASVPVSALGGSNDDKLPWLTSQKSFFTAVILKICTALIGQN